MSPALTCNVRLAGDQRQASVFVTVAGPAVKRGRVPDDYPQGEVTGSPAGRAKRPLVVAEVVEGASGRGTDAETCAQRLRPYQPGTKANHLLRLI